MVFSSPRPASKRVAVSVIMIKKYVPHLPSIHALCENNYVRVLQLLPDLDSNDKVHEFSVSRELEYRICLLDAAPYTTTLEISQVTTNTPAFLRPSMEVRLYHDARMAEVLRSQRMARIKPAYDYPNLKMHQRNEKHLVNLFLAEWLSFCLHHHVPQTSSL